MKAVAIVALLGGCASLPTVIPPTTREVIVGVTADWTATRAELRRFARDGERWRPVGDAWTAVVGRAGVAWGDGLHGVGPAPGRGGPIKREGDGKSPAGAFALRGIYGYAAEPPRGARLPYTPVDDAWKCVDDVRSSHYDEILDARRVTPDWSSAEDMRRADELYAWVIDVAHNRRRTPGTGSCIFLHVWSGEGSPTAGCTAMPEPIVRELAATLDPSTVFVLLPRTEYDAVATTWGLPAW